jgi:hypothetical protein
MTVVTTLRTAVASGGVPVRSANRRCPATFGFHNQIPPATLQQVLAGIGGAIDAAGGSFTMHYATAVVIAARTGAS